MAALASEIAPNLVDHGVAIFARLQGRLSPLLVPAPVSARHEPASASAGFPSRVLDGRPSCYRRSFRHPPIARDYKKAPNIRCWRALVTVVSSLVGDCISW